jgi:citrate/tricarballylate utilization protein
MTRRLEFTAADTHYLANLCHNCGACLHACQYAPPNPFGVNVPQSLAQVRVTTYQQFAWPRALGTLYQRNGLTVAWALTLSLALFLIATMVVQGTWWQRIEGGNFYAIFPHGLMVWMFAPVFGFSVIALGLGVRDFWRAVLPMDGTNPAPIHNAASAEAAHDALRLKYLDGGHGLGCNETDDSTTLWRKRFHHATFYGFMLCFASTSVATLYHYVWGWVAPYPVTSLPVVLGTVGGIGLVIGPLGLLWLNLQRHPKHGDAAQKPMDRAFIGLLFLCGSTGLALLAPGGKQMMVDGRGAVKILPGDERLNYKPCVDITFGSAAKSYGDKVLSVVLTGMGADGREGARLLKQGGSTVWAQDEASCVIYGMPMAIVKANLADAVYSLDEIGKHLVEACV